MKLTPFINALPLPKVLKPLFIKNGIAYYEVKMKQVYQKLHKELPETVVWGYQGTFPGPTIEVRKNDAIFVKWINKLPQQSILPLDHTVHGAGSDVPDVRTVVHLHGARVRPESDGYPDAWFTKDFHQVGPFFTTETYEYPNNMESTMLWYHDHAIGITRLNIYAGLAGLYVIRDKNEEKLNIPKGEYEIPLLIQDRSFNPDGTLYYPAKPDDEKTTIYPSVVPEFFGETILVNGMVWPYLQVEPRKYRLRFVNGSNSRFYRVSLSTNQSFYQIGTDGGFIEHPVEVKDFLLSPGERIDVIVDFSTFKDKTIIMENRAPTPFPDGRSPDPNTTGRIMAFKVTKRLKQKDLTIIPYQLNKIKFYKENQSSRTRYLSLIHTKDQYSRPLMLLDDLRWDDPITENPKLGSIEIWSLINISDDTHPIHLHLIQFQILDRQPFDVEHFNETGEIKYSGEKRGPEITESGWKDIANSHPGEVTRIIGKFKPYTGRYVWHCHMLEHEDQEMMRPYEVIQRDRFFKRLFRKIRKKE
ncbi:multicopper oxidase family protein [Pseudalkalibacillus berkeleyi]|uniref:Multicopper oxidase n=1 Tax=Pseudalkalibacillus berkeleyi TaxID=1069813 RepID=A0ABS9GXE3_9BACL|nr:multicopper oxidase [Pseudalkalibacillus berkeleyi]MCF6137447.1 multicopper oxidase [Pseudalkalibacillus berkeleyi]